MRCNENLDLFSDVNDQSLNLLNKDGEVHYYKEVIVFEQANRYLHSLLKNIGWKNDEVNLFGKRIITKRKVAWYADKPFKYTYSNTTKHASKWTDELLELKAIVEKKSGESFNSCLLNLYHDGSEGVAWHSDDEKELKKNAAIGSLSFGAERRFAFKHKKGNEKISLFLHHGSLLIMKGETQTHWAHCLPPTKQVSQPRVNLTFRMINDNY